MRLATWLALFYTWPTVAVVAQTPNIVSVGATLPASLAGDSVVMRSDGSGFFTVEVKIWEASFQAGYVCMAVVKHTRIMPGSTMWAANFGRPVYHPCQLQLNPDGLYLINSRNGETVWRTPALVGAAAMTMQDDGNLVITDAGNLILWQTFDEPVVFNIVPGMKFTVGMTLYSADVSPDTAAVGDLNVATSNYGFRIDTTGRMYAFIGLGAKRIDIPNAGFTHWSFNGFGAVPPATEVAYMALDQHPASFRFYDSRMNVVVGSPQLPDPSRLTPVVNYTPGDRKLASVVSDGGYLCTFDYAALGLQDRFEWQLLYNSTSSESKACEVDPRRCGAFSLCDSATGRCFCYDKDYRMNDKGDCVLKKKVRSYDFARVANVAFHPQLPPVPRVQSDAMCKSSCAKNKRCKAALYDPASSTCALFSEIRAVAHDPYPNFRGQVLYLKVKSGLNLGEVIGIAILGALALVCIGVLCWKFPFLHLNLGARDRRKFRSRTWSRIVYDDHLSPPSPRSPAASGASASALDMSVGEELIRVAPISLSPNA